MNETTAPAEKSAADPTEVVRDVVLVMLLQKPLAAANDLLDENLIFRADGKIVGRGRQFWFRWVRGLHDRAKAKKMAPFNLVVDRMTNEDGAVLLKGRWQVVRHGEASFSAIGETVYVVRGGKVAEIQARRVNYMFFYGKGIVRSWLVFKWKLFRLKLRYFRPLGVEGS